MNAETFMESCMPTRAATPAGVVGVLGEVLAERRRQAVLWGVQNHPDLDPAGSAGCTPEGLAARYVALTAVVGPTVTVEVGPT
jgi:hypothetical protein